MPSIIPKSLTAHLFANASSTGGNAWEAEQHMAEALYASFLLRLWREPAADVANEPTPVWMGELESIQTGRAWQFQGLERLLPLLAAQLPAIPYTGPETDDNPSSFGYADDFVPRRVNPTPTRSRSS